MTHYAMSAEFSDETWARALAIYEGPVNPSRSASYMVSGGDDSLFLVVRGHRLSQQPLAEMVGTAVVDLNDTADDGVVAEVNAWLAAWVNGFGASNLADWLNNRLGN
jgi:hypothetical protein